MLRDGNKRVSCAVVAAALVASLLFAAAAGSAGAFPVAAVIADPGATGPLTPAAVTYDLGDTAFTTPALPGPNELRGIIHYPVESGAGPFPLIVLLHGRHQVCKVATVWPCPAGEPEIPSYRGYDYLGSHLASRGFVVMSIGANGVSTFDSVADGGMQARAELIDKSIELLKGWAAGAAGSPLPAGVGSSIDFTNLGLMGHSRGGEGVVTYGQRAEAGSAGIVPKVVIPLASVDFNRPTLNTVPTATITPYCDGDVTDLSSVHFFDDSRNSATADRYWVGIDGANHNFFNTVWSPQSGQPGAMDDAAAVQKVDGDAPCLPKSPTRLSEAAQRDVGMRWMTTIFEAALHGSIAHRQMLERTQPVPGVDANRSHVNWHPGADRRSLINSFDRSARLTTGESGGAAAFGSGLAVTTCGSQAAALATCRDVRPATGPTEAPEYTEVMEPHATPLVVDPGAPSPPYVALGVARMRWGTPAPLPPTTTTTWPAFDPTTGTVPTAAAAAATPTASATSTTTTGPAAAAASVTAPGDHTLVQEIPAAQRSVGNADSIRLRIATVPDRFNRTDAQTAMVTVADGSSTSVTLNVRELDPTVLRTPPLAFLTENKGFDESFRHMLVQQLRIPVATLAAGGLNTADLRSISVTFDQASGDVVTGDWLYATETETPQPPATTTTTTTVPTTTTTPAPTVTPVPVRFTG